MIAPPLSSALPPTGQAAAASATGDASASAGAPAATSPSAIGEEFQTFIELLTAQLRHQDPLSPLDGTQFVEQLATFSTLEQQVKTNQLMESLEASVAYITGIVASGGVAGAGEPSGSAESR